MTVLPSIREMFPEHLMYQPSKLAASPTRSEHSTSPSCDASTSRLLSTPIPQRRHWHPSDFAPPPSTSPPTGQARDLRGSPTSSASSTAGLASDDEEDDDGQSDGPSTGRKHTCALCKKSFNRPSSLHIHMNTHTGATPFQCPFPTCGRLFNVNSNMRRHYRNHRLPRVAPPLREYGYSDQWMPNFELAPVGPRRPKSLTDEHEGLRRYGEDHGFERPIRPSHTRAHSAGDFGANVWPYPPRP